MNSDRPRCHPRDLGRRSSQGFFAYRPTKGVVHNCAETYSKQAGVGFKIRITNCHDFANLELYC